MYTIVTTYLQHPSKTRAELYKIYGVPKLHTLEYRVMFSWLIFIANFAFLVYQLLLQEASKLVKGMFFDAP